MGVFTPVIVIFACLFCIIFVVMGMPYLASAPMISSQSSVNLTSTGSNFSALIPFFALMVAGGVVVVTLDQAR